MPARRTRGYRGWLRFLVPAVLLAAVLGAGALAWAETEAVNSYWEGLWRSLALVTTVGFVGPVPTTATGKLVSSILMILGFALLAMTTAAVASLFVREDEIPDAERERQFHQAVLAELGELRREVAQLRESRAVDVPAVR
jgi:voltage-gated potassium channel